MSKTAEELAIEIEGLITIDDPRYGFDPSASLPISFVTDILNSYRREILQEAADKACEWLRTSDLYFMPEETKWRETDINELTIAIMGEEE